MNEQNHLVPLTQPRSLLPTQGEWQTMLQMADALVKSGLLPQSVGSPQAVIAIMQLGQELGLRPMNALSNIQVIKGKPTCSAELMRSLIYRDHGDNALMFTESTDQRCTISYARRDWTERMEHSFTTEDAKRAGLQGDNWGKYPAQMLRARCTSAVAKMAFPDSISGMYTAEELGAEVRITPEGEEIVLAPEQPDVIDAEVAEGQVREIRPAPSEQPHAQVERIRSNLKSLAKLTQTKGADIMLRYIADRQWKVTPEGLSSWPPPFKEQFEQYLLDALDGLDAKQAAEA